MLKASKGNSDIHITVPRVFEPLFTNARRRNFIYGGRGSGKSHAVAQYCIYRAYKDKIKVLCTRELQKTIDDSVFALLRLKIESMGLQDFFTVYKSGQIVGLNGSEFIFAGVRQNVSEIKSMEGISICWVEEAQAMSRESLEVLIPTIRAEGSLLIFTFNPYKDTDPVYVETMKGGDDTLIIKANYRDNPYFPEVLRGDMERDKRDDEDKYRWVWEGECIGVSDAQIFKGKYEVKAFDTPANAEFHFGADWGFANDPTAVIRSFIIGNTLYIDESVSQVGCDLDDTPALFDKVDGTALYPIYADSARPETISFMRSRRYNVIGAEKWAGSVEDGIQYLRGFSKIVIHPRCKDVIREFELYQYKTDRQTGQILREPLDRDNHFIDALRYSLVVSMRQKNNGKVYSAFTRDAIEKESEEAVGDIYFGTYQSPGKVQNVIGYVRGGKIRILDAFSTTGIDFESVRGMYPKGHILWMPLVSLKDTAQEYAKACENAGCECAIGVILPAEGDGTKLVNDLFSRGALYISEGAWLLISSLNERVYLSEGKLERSGRETENVRYCKLFEYLVWRIAGRLM